MAKLDREVLKKEILTTAEVLELLGISRQYLRKFLLRGEIEPLKRGIYLREDVERIKDKVNPK